MALTPGDHVGGYEIVSRLGAGGMGVVYRARDPKLGRDVAIKLLSAKDAGDAERLKRFEQEARAASALDHPNIITIHEIGETDDGRPFIVMQLVDGKSVRELIAAKRLSLADVLRIAVQIADGLARAHRNGIIHRDLKPDNVMVNADGLVKILDFGLAKLSEPAAGSELQTIERDKPLTGEGRIVGTAQYMSPEQAQGESVDARSDIFSLGAILFEMVTGRRAFKGDNAVALLADIVSREPERLTALDPSLPVDLDKIVHRALRKDPNRRFQNVSDLRVALAELTEELESGDALTASDVRPAHNKRLRRWPLAAAVGLAIAAVVTLMWVRRTEVAPMGLVPLTTDPGYEWMPALSPDGTQLAYAKRGHIYVKLIGEGEAVQLTDKSSDISPTWSPDGTRIAFLRHRSRNRTEHDVMEVPALGGTPRVIGRADGNGHGLSYSPDGTEIAVIHKESPDEAGAVFLLSTDTGEHRRLTAARSAGNANDRHPKFTPDGKSIVFARVREGPDARRHGDIMVFDLESSTEHVVLAKPGMLDGHDVTPDGRHIVFAVGKSWDSMHLESIPIGGGERTTHLPGERAGHPALARRANRAVFIRRLDDWNIWRAGGPAARKPRAPEPIVDSTWLDMNPDLSPDDTTLAFSSGRSGDWQIWLANPDGTSQRQLSNVGGAAMPQWSPDGSRIAFHASVDGVFQVFVIDAAGGFERQLTQNELNSVMPRWSPDGRYLSFDVDRRGENEIWRVPVEGGSPELLMQNASFAWPMADDSWVFERDETLLLRGLDGELTELGDWSFLRWTVWRNHIVGVRDIGDTRVVAALDLETGEQDVLMELGERAPDIATPAVSADGQWIYYMQQDAGGTDVMLVENFVP